MSNANPGQVTCPFCGGATPPAIFCTQCGEPLPASLRARPAGMDRSTIDERIRERRGMDAPIRPGATPDERQAASRGYVPFVPDPLDAVVRRDAPGGGVAPRTDYQDREPAPEPVPTSYPEPVPQAVPEAMPGAVSEPSSEPVAAAEPEPLPVVAPQPEPEPTPVVAPHVPIAQPPRPLIEPIAPRIPQAPPPPPVVAPPSVAWNDDADRGWAPAPADQYEEAPGGVSGVVVGAFIALGLVAVIGGALLAGVLGPGTANASPTPSQAPSVAPSQEPTLQPTPTLEPTPSVEATPTPTLLPPGVFPDGFTAQVQPCATRPNSGDGCDSSGSVVTRDVWVWIAFEHGNDSDVLTATLINADSQPVGDADYALVDLDCGPDCGGWVYFRFPSLSAGAYRVVVDRNGDFAAETSFTATG